MMLRKRLVSLFTAVVLAFSISATGFAASIVPDAKDYTPHTYGVNVPNSGTPGTIGMTRVLAECNGGPHDMLAHGWGSIYNVTTGEWVVRSGACAQCTKCNLVIVTQNDPGSGAALGYYTTWQPNEELSSYNTIIHQSSNNIIYTSSTSIPGIRFRFA